MATTTKQLAQAAPATGSNTTIYTAPGAGKAHIKEMLVHNPEASAGTVEIWAVPSAGSPANSNKLFKFPIQPDETKVLSMNTILEASGFISLKPTTAQVTCTLSGYEVT